MCVGIVFFIGYWVKCVLFMYGKSGIFELLLWYVDVCVLWMWGVLCVVVVVVGKGENFLFVG